MKIGRKPLTPYQQMQVASHKRKQAAQKAMDNSQMTRNVLASTLNDKLNGQVKLVEQILRSRSGINKKV